MCKLFCLCVLTALSAIPAHAQFRWFDPPERDRRPYLDRFDRYDRDRFNDRYLRYPPERKKEALPRGPEPEREQLPAYVHVPGKAILVFVKTQQYAAYNNGVPLVLKGIKMQGPVSTGALGHRTPLSDVEKGPSSIEYKKIDYVSNTYPLDEYGNPSGGAEMPYAMFWNRKGGYALHAGTIPRWKGEAYGHSKGCVRLPADHARLLFENFSGPDVRVIIMKDTMALYEQWELALAQAQAMAKK